MDGNRDSSERDMVWKKNIWNGSYIKYEKFLPSPSTYEVVFPINLWTFSPKECFG